MKKLNFLSNLWSSGGNSQGSDVGFDRRFTVGSPSFHRRSTMLKLVSVLALIFTLGVGNVWGQAASQAPANGSTYVVTYYTNSKYYALPNSITGGGTLSGTQVTVNGSGQVTSDDPPTWTLEEGTGDNAGKYYLKFTSGGNTYYLYKNGTNSSNKNFAVGTTNKNYWTFATSGTGYTATAVNRGSNRTKIGYENNAFCCSGTAVVLRLLPVATSGPTLTTSSSMTTLTYSAGSPVAQSFTIGGSNLTSTVTVTAPTDYEVCKTSGGSYTSSVSFTNTEVNAADKTVYIRLQSGLSGGNISSRDITVASSGADSKTIAVTGSVPYTITWMANGNTHATTYVAVGSTLALPATDPVPNTCGCTGKAFYGWYGLGTSYSNASIAPTIATAGDAVSVDKTYYAVFADAEGGEPTPATLTFSYASHSGWSFGGSYSDMSTYYRLNSVSGNMGYVESPTISDMSTITSIDVYAAYYGGSGYGKFKVYGGNTQYGTEQSPSSNSRKQYTLSPVSNPLSGSGKIKIICSGTSYDSAKGTRLYDVTINYTTGGTTYSNYTTTCCTDPGLAYATGSVTKTYGAGVFTNPLTNSHSVGVTYDSSDKTVATVDSEGEVTILKAGTTTITATFAGNATYCADDASYTLTVNKADISPSLSYSSTTLVIGNNSSSPTVGGNSGGGTVTYAITTESTSGVVTLNTTTGVVTAAKEGTATITATIPATTNYNGGSATANFTVTCGAPSSVDISGNYQFYPGETISLTATPTGGAGTPVTYQWKKDGVNIVGATSATYTKDDATVSDAGSYTCTVQYGSNCATTSDAFKLKCMQFYLKTSGGADISNHALTKVDATHATLSLSLTGGTTYKFRVTDGCGDWYGNTGEMTSSNCTNWAMDADADCRVTTSSKSATYVFNFDFSGGLLGSEMKVTVVYPSSNQASGKVIYWDNEVNKWNGSKLWYRIGKNNHNANTQLSKVAGTANFYSVTTSQYDGFEYWHIANNQGQGTGNIFWTKDNSGSGLEITNAMGFEGAPVTDATVTVTPTTTHSTGGSSDNNNCEFYTYSITSGVKSYTVTSSATNCTVAMEKYNNDAGSSTTALASGGTVMPTQYVKVTVTPNTGYQFSSVSVTNGTTVTAAAAGTPGVYYITGNATVTATCTVKSCTVNFDKNSGTGGDASTTATYGSAMTTVTAPTRTGYTFDGYWDGAGGTGTQYYLANGTSARNWDKDVTAAQTLYAKWNAKQYTIELDREGASTGAESVTATYDAGTLAGWSAPSKTGYSFGGYWSGDNGIGTLVISTTGVLQNSVTISSVAWTDGSGHWVKDGGATVYAKWTANVYNITYKDQGDVAYSGNKTDGRPTGNPATHTYGSATALVNGVKDGYRFDGWFTDASCTVSAGSSIGATAKTADFTLYAKWTQVYTVTWHVNGSTYNTGVVDGNSHVVSGGKISAPPTAPADNTLSACADKFMGWSAKNGGSDAKTTSYYDDLFTDVTGSPYITSNKDFYAVFAEVPDEKHWEMGTIDQLSTGSGYATYDGVHTVTGSDGNDYTYTSSNVMSNSGNQFRGSSYCGRIYNTTTLGRITKIELVAGSYVSEMKVYESASSITASPGSGAITPSVDGSKYTYEFTGKGFFLIIQEGSHAAKANVTVYFGDAPSNYRTQCDANMVKVTYDANGGSTTCAGGSHDKRNDYTVCSSAPTRDYYTFAGWLCSADSKTYAASATIDDAVIDADFSLTAQWTPVNYTITYNLHGGTTAGGNPTSYNVTTATIDLADGTYGHNRFEGWYNTYNEGTGAYSGQVTNIPLGSHGDITLHAKWTTRHEIIFDADGATTTIYRADDEAMDASVAGQGSVPSDPSAPSTCSTKVFVGWSESEIDDETNTRPGDLMKPAEGKVDEDKHYYAVWALRAGSPAPATYAGTGTFVKITSMSEVETDTYYVLRGIDGSTVKVMKNTISSGKMGTADDPVSENVITNPGVAIVWKLGGKKDAYTLYNQSVSKYVEITGNSTGGYALNASPTSGATYTLTIEDGHGFFFKSNYSTANSRGISIYNASEFRSYGLANAKTLELYKLPAYTYSAYSTSCCETKVNLTHNSPEHGTVEFSKSRIGTCNSDKEVSLTITPDAGYKLTGWTVNTTSGYADAKTTSPAVATTNNNSATQNITLTFAQDANKNYDVSATFGLMTVESWTWTYNSAAMPNPLNLYIGQSARLDVAYTPAGVDNSKKTYTRTKEDAYINWVGVAQSTYTTISGRASTGENTTPVTFTHADGPTTTVNVKVLPLPAVHFGDIVHNVEFADVVATLSDNTLSPTKTTPTHADFDGATKNTCEEEHLHLVGWIRGDWPSLVTYLNGGAKPSTDDITGAGNDGSGNAYFFTPGASINTQTFNGVTFYAVWAKVE